MSNQKPIGQDDVVELETGRTVLHTSLLQISQAFPGLLAIAWVGNGPLGSLTAIRSANDPQKLVFAPSTVEQTRALATFIADLPDGVQEMLDVQLAAICAVRAAEEERTAQTWLR